jgi:DNA-binding NarL/FixJ family response regulator
MGQNGRMSIRLIGRDAELATLGQAISQDCGMTLLSGEAGIGKSRLALEVLARARQRGVTTLEGRAHPLHAGLAYAPVVEALRPRLDAITDYSGLADLGRLLADRRLPVAPPLGDPQLERTRMFEAVAAMIRQVAPMVLFIDDVHWADAGTIELLHYVSGSAPVLVTCRTSDVQGPLRELVTAVRRDDRQTELVLGPLPDSAVAEIARDLLGTVPEPDLLDDVTARARGVPLFVTALLQGDAARAGALPAIVRDVVSVRLDRLAVAERRLLETIAAAGGSATEDLLAEVAGEPRQAIRRLLADGLITESHFTYRVGHPMYAEVAYADLTIGERRGLHAAIAEALHRRTPDDFLALAPHYLQAGDLVDLHRAGTALAEAGWRALLINEADEAARYLLAALQAKGEQTAEAMELLDGIGQAHLKAGRIADAMTAWGRSAELAKRLGHHEKLSGLRFRLALMESERGNMESAERHALDGSVPLDDLASQTIALRMIYTVRHCPHERARLIVSQLDAPVTGHPASLASNEMRLSLAANLDGDLAGAREHAERAVRYGKKCHEDWPVLSNWAAHDLVGLCVTLGDVTAAVEYAHQALIMQNTTGISPARSTARVDMNLANYLGGNLAKAAKDSLAGIELARRMRVPRSLARALLCRALFLAEQGKQAEAEECLREAAEIKVGHEPGLIALRESVETVLAEHAGRPEEAPPLTYWALFHEPMAMVIRMVHAWRAGVVPPSHGFCPLLDVVADAIAGQDVVEELDRMGVRLLAAQARMRRPAEILQCIAVFEQEGAAPWTARARRIARSAGVHVPNPRGDGPLSRRETDVVRLVGQGLSNADIAARLFLSERTVESHLRSSYAKLGLSSRVKLAQWAAGNLE